jgi:hypothetical protein
VVSASNRLTFTSLKLFLNQESSRNSENMDMESGIFVYSLMCIDIALEKNT